MIGRLERVTMVDATPSRNLRNGPSRLDQGPVPAPGRPAYCFGDGPPCQRTIRRRRIVKTIVLVSFMSLVIAAGASDVLAQTAGSSVISVSKSEMRQVATGWSAKK